MKKRLVSVYYNCFHPFDQLSFIEDTHTSDDPAELKEGDIIIIHGGGDIHPSLYNKRASSYAHVDHAPTKRDKIEWAFIQRAKELKLPILGICRGAQMLCAAAGGYLIQHVNNHGGRHHEVTTSDGQKFMTNSIHHQMMQPEGTDHELVGWSTDKLSDMYIGEGDKKEAIEIEPEMIYFKGLNGFAFQWHPEAMRAHTPATQYILNYIEERVA